MSDIIKQGFSAVKWGALSSIARFALQIIAQAVMARALGPEAYGVFGMGLVVFTFANFFAEFGFSWSLIYRKSLQKADIRFAFTYQVLCGGIVGLTIFFSAPFIAEYFREPRVILVVKWIAVCCLLSAATAPANNLLVRELRFRESGLIQISSYFVGYLLIGVPMALSNQGINALIAAFISMSAVRFIGCYWCTRHPVRPLLRHADARAIIVGGGTVFLTNITNCLLSNLDRLLVGRLLSAQSMGFYSVGSNLANTPNGLLLSALQPAFLAAGAKLGDDTYALRSAYQRVLSASLSLTLPLYITLAALAPAIIGTLYGKQWADAAPVLSILLLAMPAFVVWGISTPVLWNTGRASHEALLQWPVLLVAFGLLVSFAHLGIIATACITAGVLSIRGFLMVVWACRAVKINPTVFLPDLGRGLMFGLLCGSVASGVSFGLVEVPAIAVLLAGSTTTVLCGIVLLRLWPDLLGLSGRAVLNRLSPKLMRLIFR